MSKKAIETVGYDAFKTHPVGTGPFMLETIQADGSLRLKAHTQYFRDRPRLNTIDVSYLPDVGERIAALKNLQTDVIELPSNAKWVNQVKGEQGIHTDIFGVGEAANFHFNLTVPPFDDLRVRQAIAYAINRDEFIQHFGGDPLVGKVFSHVPDVFLPGGLAEEEVRALGLDYTFDVEKANILLADAGYADGFSLDLVSSDRLSYRESYELLQKQLERVGIRLNIAFVDHATFHKKIRADVNQIVRYASWRPNADVYLTRFFHSDSIVVTGKKPDTNFSHYDKIDDLIEAARYETNPAKQEELWKHAQIKILQDMAAISTHYTNKCFARREYVDYGHELVNSMSLYPQITEKTRIVTP